MKNLYFLSTLFILLLASCIGDDFIDDFVEPEIRILNPIQSLETGSTYQIEVLYLNNVGEQEATEFIWSSSDSNIASVDANGILTAVSPGVVNITIQTQLDLDILDTSFELEVGESTIEAVTSIQGIIETTTFYTLEGNFEINETANGIVIDIDETYRASSNLPGLYVYLSNNRNNVSNAHEISRVDVFSGAHSYEIEDVSINDYNFIVYFCKPFNVKVGEAEIKN